MKKFLGTFLLAVMVITVMPQYPKARQAEIDSLMKLLASSGPDTHRVSILSDLALRSSRTNHKQALEYAHEGLVLAQTLKFRKGEADCLRRIGIIIVQEGRYPEALDFYQRALIISESIHDLFGIAAGLGHIGEIYADQGDYQEARSYYYRYLEINNATHNEREQANALIKIGRTFLLQNNLDSATLYYNLAGNKVLNSRNEVLSLWLWKDWGELNAKKGNDELAISFFRKSAQYAAAGNDFLSLNESYLGLADLYRKDGHSDSCIFYGRLALTAAQQNNYPKGIAAASELLATVYELIDEHEAFRYYKIATGVRDSLFNAEKARQLQNIFFVEQQRKQSIESARIENRNSIRLYAVLGALALFLILAIVLYRNSRQKQKANELLQHQKDEIQKTLAELRLTQTQLIQSEKMASLGELTAGIAHEIQNPLNFVNNFSEINRELADELLQEADKGNLDEVKAIARDIKDNEQKINHHGKRADGIVKGMLQHSRRSNGKKEPTDINALADEYLRLAYHGLRAKDISFNATMKTDYDAKIAKINIIPQDMGRVILNLITNAFYAVTEKKKQIGEGYEPTVSVSTKKINDKIEVTVADNGNGIPQKLLDKIFQPFFTTKPTGEGTGLGLSLSYDIAKAHGGELKVETKEGEGSEFIIQLAML